MVRSLTSSGQKNSISSMIGSLPRLFKSNERSEDSYKVLADFSCFFFNKKSENIDALRYNARFEFN